VNRAGLLAAAGSSNAMLEARRCAVRYAMVNTGG